MSQPFPQASYLFDRKQADQDRLIRFSETLSGFTTEACVRAGLGPGGRAIDIGCGLLGALLVLAEQVGPDGRVVGLDASGEALTLARQILDQRGCTTVSLVQAELDTVPTTALCPPGPFDLAFIRQFLVHQPDPAGSLRHIASLVRSGGRIVAHEIPPGASYPALTPPVPALQRVVELVHLGIQSRGGRYDAAHYFPALCQDAGLHLVSQRGFLPATEPVEPLVIHQAVLRSMQQVLITQGLTTEGEVDALWRELEEAKAMDYIGAFANLYIEMIAETP
jgi:SAM-dependent methyltransferase